MVNSETKAFFILLFTCTQIDRYNKDEARLRRAMDIIVFKWGIEDWRVDMFIKDHHSSFDGSKMNIDKYAAYIPEKARLKLFILCMDIISSGNPIEDREGIVIDRLRDALKILDQDFTRIVWFCKHRNNAVNIRWEKGVRQS